MSGSKLYTALILVFTIIACFNHRAGAQVSDLKLTAIVSPDTTVVSMGDTVLIRFEVYNNGPDDAANVSVAIGVNGTLVFLDTTLSQGTLAGGVWNIGVVQSGPTGLKTLELLLRKDAEGVAGIISEISAMTGTDPDSQPNNNNYSEDDYQFICLSSAYEINNGQTITMTLPAGTSGIQWYLDNTPIPGATGLSLTTGQPGVYNFTSVQGGCPNGECCPVVVALAPSQSPVLDYGDLPDDNLAGAYPTDAISSAGEGLGPSHLVVDGLKIGAIVDDETGGFPSALANGDDTDNTDDEDGIAAFPVFTAGQNAVVVVDVMNMMTPGATATLYGFIDWNKDGDFLDPNESVFAAVPDATNGPINLNFNVPAGAVIGMDLGARFRLSTQSGLTATGYAPDGEVEDYLVQVQLPCALTLTAFPGVCTPASNTYTLFGALTFTNPPATGMLTVSVAGGGSQVFNAPFTSPINYNIGSLTSDGAGHTATAVFSDNAGCTDTESYTAPVSCTGCGTPGCGTTTVVKN